MDFVTKLGDANASSIYVWTPHAPYCGAILAPSFDTIKLDFAFDINKSGIISFVTSDASDRPLLDFFEAPSGEQRLEVETLGQNWESVTY
jgi:hypothetical protein